VVRRNEGIGTKTKAALSVPSPSDSPLPDRQDQRRFHKWPEPFLVKHLLGPVAQGLAFPIKTERSQFRLLLVGNREDLVLEAVDLILRPRACPEDHFKAHPLAGGISHNQLTVFTPAHYFLLSRKSRYRLLNKCNNYQFILPRPVLSFVGDLNILVLAAGNSAEVEDRPVNTTYY